MKLMPPIFNRIAKTQLFIFAFFILLFSLSCFYNFHTHFLNSKKLSVNLEIRNPSLAHQGDVYLSALELDEAIHTEEFLTFNPHSALEDPYNRISKKFRITKENHSRVRFWFDIYTKYSQYHHIIHNTLSPWIIYEVIDTTPFLKGSGPLWLRKQRGLDLVEKRKQFYIKRYANKNIRSQMGQKDFFIRGIENSAKYLHYMEDVFSEHALPIELTRIPFVESSFNEAAHSRVGASGVWQIMPNIGKKFSLSTGQIDERNSPIKASQVAAKLLKQNYSILKSWPLAITAYNNGVGNIHRAIRKANSRDLNIIIKKNHSGAFRFASSNFYSSFLAALYAEKYKKEIFQTEKIIPEKKLAKVKYKLSKPWKALRLAKKIGVELSTLLALNLDLKSSINKNLIIPSGFELFVPIDKVDSVRSQLL